MSAASSKSSIIFYVILNIFLKQNVVGRPTVTITATQFKFTELAEIVLTHRYTNEDLTENETTIKLFGNFSPVGSNYETGGDVVQVSSFRACDARRKGLDHTVFEHVSVVFVDDVQPFLTGCVALDNQARFAEKSGAMALVVGPSTRVEKTIRPMTIGKSKIPIIVLDDDQTIRLRNELSLASQHGSVVKISIKFDQQIPAKVLKLQVFRPTILNICLLGLLIILISFVSLLVVIKIRCKPTMHRELWLRALARTALTKMEIRNFEKSTTDKMKKRKMKAAKLDELKNENSSKSRNSSYLAVFGSLTSVDNLSTIASSTQDKCVICLEEYENGTELRVLFCGHEFHPKCVDPWLLSNRRCPLCQFDVVYKNYPKIDFSQKEDQVSLLPRHQQQPPPPPQPQPQSQPTSLQNSSSSSSPQNHPNNSSRPLRSIYRNSHFCSSNHFRWPQPRNYHFSSTHRARSCPRRRQLRPRHQLDSLIRIGGYSSDVSSSHPDLAN